MYTNPRTGAWMRQLDSVAGNMSLERLMKPHSGKADAHVHLDFDERYEILEGTATVELAGRRIEAPPARRWRCRGHAPPQPL